MKKYIFFSIAAVIIIGAAVFSGMLVLRPPAVVAPATLPRTATSSVALLADFGPRRIVSLSAVPLPDETLGEFMERVLVAEHIPLRFQTYGDLGRLVAAIGEYTNGTEGRYWQYWVNGAYATVGADAYRPRPGDTVQWRFTKENEQP